MSRYLVLTEDGDYKEVAYPPHHDHWTYDYHTDIYYEDSPNGYYTDQMLKTLKLYGIERNKF